MNKLYIIDAMAHIYRAHFAFSKNPRITSYGLNTSAVFGFVNTLLELRNKEKPTHLAVAFDSIEPTERAVEFSDYKANREKMPEDMAIAIPYVKKVISAMRIPLYEMPGYEADDIIGTLAKMGEKNNYEVYCVSPDKDFAQLVSSHVFLYRHGRMGNETQIWDLDKVKEKWEVERAEQVIDILGLWGDSVDNIPGVPGVGEKKAKQLIKEYDNLENILSHAPNIKGKLGENLVEFADQARLSKSLATIITDVPIPWEAEKMQIQDYDEATLKPLFEELEFRALMKRIFKEEPTAGITTRSLFGDDYDFEEKTEAVESLSPFETFDGSKVNYVWVDSAEELRKIADKILAQKYVCVDTETTSLDTLTAQIVGVSLSLKEGEAFFVSFSKDENNAEIIELLKSFLENKEVKKIGQNLKFDINIFKTAGIEVVGELEDTMLAHYLIEPDGKHGMDDMSKKYLNYQPISITTLIGEKKTGQISMSEVPKEKLLDYAAEDTDVTLRLSQQFSKEIEQEKQKELFSVECDLVYVLAEMERVGVKLDLDFLNNYSAELSQEIEVSQEQIFSMVGEEFNIASPKQLGVILFDKLKISDKPPLTKTGQYKTDESVLNKYAKEHPFVSEVLNFRELQKLKSTYVDALPTMVHPKTQRVHTMFNQALTVTGRLSSNNPNLQNIPIKTERGRKIRQAFIPDADAESLLSADYSQVEIRIMAEFSQDENMLGAFARNEDIHSDTAAKIFGVSIEQVSKEQRRQAKAINFGIIYGQTPFGLAQSLSISRSEAKEIIDSYFAKYIGVKNYIDQVQKQAAEEGYVSTLLGRKRYLRDINSGNKTLREFAMRNAINMPIQGTAADMIKVAMNGIRLDFKKYDLKSRMILQVHDELVFEIIKGELETVRELVTKNMKTALNLRVPIEVEAGIGANWLEAH